MGMPKKQRQASWQAWGAEALVGAAFKGHRYARKQNKHAEEQICNNEIRDTPEKYMETKAEFWGQFGKGIGSSCPTSVAASSRSRRRPSDTGC